jgi:hypothetical protein
MVEVRQRWGVAAVVATLVYSQGANLLPKKRVAITTRKSGSVAFTAWVKETAVLPRLMFVVRNPIVQHAATGMMGQS